jgi:AcrR family transcriptional regulator
VTVRRRLPPEERREQVIAATRELIVARGFGTVSLRDIARAAGVAVGTVTYHFAGVDELLGAVVVSESERFYDEVIRVADATESPWLALRALMEPMFTDRDAPAHWRIWTEYWSVVARRPTVLQAYVKRIHSWEACCARTVRRGIATGVYREVNVDVTALKLAAYADGIATQLAQGRTEISSEGAVDAMMELAAALLSPS